MSAARHDPGAVPTTGPLLVLALVAASAGLTGCDEAARQAAPVKVSAAGDQRDGPEPPISIDADPVQEDDGVEVQADVGGGPGGLPGGLWVIDAKGAPVGLLVQRGHPQRDESNTPDLLQDGVLVYAPGPGLFFGLSMARGEVLVPRLGLGDSACAQPLVAGYYTAGPQVAGTDYAFAWRGSWYRIASGASLKLVQCAGVSKQGVLPKCVLHAGSCRGFPVQKISPSLPLAFPPPLRFAWKGAIP